MRFGKTYVLGLTENYRAFTEEIIKTVEYSGQINNQWKWSESKPLNDAKNFMLGSVQDYVFQLYEVKDDNIIPYIGSIAESVLKLYPDHVESLSNLSITYLVKKEYDNALIPLLKAEKLSPKDYIVLSNIAWCYYQKKDKLNAIKYYELVLKYGDEGAMNFANEKLVELKKSN
ncbi:Tetratricopeptide repeat protein [compost metagenome]